ncbi:MAG: IscS subfamily cysteine desulfurase, partial [Chloroflexi bacterium]|nr:IscS subfamily cysteine desulfurase [Chloroflexota bacterium]
SQEPSYVIRALGRSEPLAHSAIRFSLGRQTTTEDIEVAVTEVRQLVERLRATSPLWELER